MVDRREQRPRRRVGAARLDADRTLTGSRQQGAGIEDLGRRVETAEALQEFFNELNGILKPVPADELTRAKNYITLRFPSSFETTSGIARRLEDALVYHLPDNYFETFVDRINRVDANDVTRVAAKYVQPSRMITLIVGDYQAISEPIQALGVATPAVVAAET